MLAFWRRTRKHLLGTLKEVYEGLVRIRPLPTLAIRLNRMLADLRVVIRNIKVIVVTGHGFVSLLEKVENVFGLLILGEFYELEIVGLGEGDEF